MFSRCVKQRVDLVCSLAKLALAFSILCPTFSYADDTKIRQKRSTTRDIDDDHISEDKLKSPGLENFIFLEFRPTLNYTPGEAHTENSAEYGIVYDKTMKFSYVQLYSTNLYNSRTKKSVFKTPLVRLYDGFLRLKFGELWVSEDKQSKFSYQLRTYFPTNSPTETAHSKYEQGMIVTLRNYFTFDEQVSPDFKWQFSIVPAFYFARKAGYTFGTKSFARENFDIQFITEFDYKFLPNLELEFPIVMQVVKFGEFGIDAELNGIWKSLIAIQPELDWSYVKDQTLGIAYNSDSFIKQDFKKTQFPVAFNKGNVQLVWNIKF